MGGCSIFWGCPQVLTTWPSYTVTTYFFKAVGHPRGYGRVLHNVITGVANYLIIKLSLSIKVIKNVSSHHTTGPHIFKRRAYIPESGILWVHLRILPTSDLSEVYSRYSQLCTLKALKTQSFDDKIWAELRNNSGIYLTLLVHIYVCRNMNMSYVKCIICTLFINIYYYMFYGTLYWGCLY